MLALLRELTEVLFTCKIYTGLKYCWKKPPSLQENGKSHDHGNFLSGHNSVDEKNVRLQQAILRRQALLDQLKVSLLNVTTTKIITN